MMRGLREHIPMFSRGFSCYFDWRISKFFLNFLSPKLGQIDLGSGLDSELADEKHVIERRATQIFFIFIYTPLQEAPNSSEKELGRTTSSTGVISIRAFVVRAGLSSIVIYLREPFWHDSDGRLIGGSGTVPYTCLCYYPANLNLSKLLCHVVSTRLCDDLFVFFFWSFFPHK